MAHGKSQCGLLKQSCYSSKCKRTKLEPNPIISKHNKWKPGHGHGFPMLQAGSAHHRRNKYKERIGRKLWAQSPLKTTQACTNPEGNHSSEYIYFECDIPCSNVPNVMLHFYVSVLCVLATADMHVPWLCRRPEDIRCPLCHSLPSSLDTSLLTGPGARSPSDTSVFVPCPPTVLELRARA